MLRCPFCNKTVKIPIVEKLIEIKGNKTCPFIHYVECCSNRKLKIILKQNNAITTEFVEI